MTKKSLLLILVLYIVSTAAAYGAMTVVGPKSTPVVVDTTDTGDGTELGNLLKIDPSEPKNQACPLNGRMYTNTEKTAWEKRRPLAVMIENTPDARPQSGLSRADVVFEAVAEGGITRFMGMFYCGVQVADTDLAPIRSARSYFIDWASGFNLPMYVHVGGANIPGPADALGQLGQYGWNGQNDMNQFSIGYPTFVRDYNRVPGKEIATEHTMVTSTEKLWQVADKRGWTNMSPSRKVGTRTIAGSDWKAGYTGWTYGEESPGKGTNSTISYEFWSGYDDYAVVWNYDRASNSYQRSQGGEAHVDLNDNSRIAAKNVVILFTSEKGPIDEAKHMLYGTTGTGNAIVFQNGEAIEAKWSKKDREGELQFTDSKGKALPMLRGMTWISVLATGAKVAY